MAPKKTPDGPASIAFDADDLDSVNAAIARLKEIRADLLNKQAPQSTEQPTTKE